MTHNIAAWLTSASGVPDPSPQAPPGGDDILTVLNWVMWLALAAGVVGFIAVGIMMALQNSGRMQSGGQHAAALGWVAGGCIVIGAASGLVTMFA